MTTDQPFGRTQTDPTPPVVFEPVPPATEPFDPGAVANGYELLYPEAPPAAAPALERPARRWRFAPRSLTSRLVVGVVSLVVILVLATGVSTYVALRSFLYQRLDQQISQVASGNQNRVTQCLAGPFSRCTLGTAGASGLHTPLTEWLIILDSKGSPFGTVNPGDGLMPMQLSAAQRASIVAAPTENRSLTTVDGANLRVSARALSTQTGNYVLVSGLSTDELERTLSRLLKLEIAIGASAVVIAFVTTAYGVRFSLRRLHRVTRTAQDVAAELSPEGAGLDRRVPVTEPGTEVGQLAESMNTLLSAVETQFAARLDSERRMAQFLADASHELRTPLTSIRGYAELARMQRAVGGTQEDNLERIESEGTRMSRLVEDLLTLARGDQGSRPERELVDVTELLDDAASGARAAFPQRLIQVEAAADQHLIGDHDQLLRVVRNLVTNAAVHTRPDGAITLRAFPDGPGVAIQVVDAGPGLPPDEAAHVFERFWRADKARTRVRGGSGLGLAIVSSVVTAHGGTVHFQSTVETGSTVTVWLPVGTL